MIYYITEYNEYDKITYAEGGYTNYYIHYIYDELVLLYVEDKGAYYYPDKEILDHRFIDDINADPTYLSFFNNLDWSYIDKGF